jgi:hypothetical protein
MTSIFRSATAWRVRFSLPVAPAVLGFALLMAGLFAVSYAVGCAAGPVAPGIQQPAGGSGPGGTSHGSGGMGGMAGTGM